ncbi:BTB/POZ domain-containing protein KCTD6 [Exaiptasia diaphana]|nr:BTB/POZ domain-containing protein KCTD6 [Exaiptasia diaphana]
MEDKEASRTPDHESKDEKLHLDLSPVSDLIKSLSGTVEEKSKRHYKDEIELGSPGKGKVRVYRTSQVIEQDGILEQAIFLFPSVYPDSRLAKMCNGIVPLSKDVRGNTFIDRDGETFRYILSFLRTKKLKLPLDFKSFDELEAEAEYFEIYDLVEELKKEKSKYTKQNSYIRLSYFSKKKGVVLAGEVKNLVEIIPKPIPGAQLKTGEDFHFSTGEKVVQGAQMEIPLKPTQVDALVQHIIDAGYVIEGSKVMFDGNDQTWVFVRRIN